MFSTKNLYCFCQGTACEGTLKDFLRRGVDLESFLSVDEDEDEHDEYDHHEDDKRLSVAPSGGLLLEGNLSTSILSLHVGVLYNLFLDTQERVT